VIGGGGAGGAGGGGDGRDGDEWRVGIGCGVGYVAKCGRSSGDGGGVGV